MKNINLPLFDDDLLAMPKQTNTNNQTNNQTKPINHQANNHKKDNQQKNNHTLRILHTADWHIGKKFADTNRYEEFDEFLKWLLLILDDKQVDVLIVSGDVFDTVAPSNYAQSLYYQFLNAVQNSHCQHIIITAGNHDSPSFLEAPKELLKNLNIYVIGTPTDTMDDEIIVLYNQFAHDTQSTPQKTPVAIICAIPYLRDSDIRHKYTKTQFGDSLSTLETNTALSIRQYYHDILTKAHQLKQSLQKKHQCTIPLIATGHFFATGASTSSDDDGMRSIHHQTNTYVGNLGGVDVSDMPYFDYMALGHIHKTQIVAKNNNIRYSGSPIVMGFGECMNKKYVLLVDFDNNKPIIYPLPVPRFRAIIHLTGDLMTLQNQIDTLNNSLDDLYDKDNIIIHHKKAMLGILYTGEFISDLRDKIKSYLSDDIILVQLKIQPTQTNTPTNYIIDNPKELTAVQVFEHVLSKETISDDNKIALKQLYQQIINEIHEEDVLGT